MEPEVAAVLLATFLTRSPTVIRLHASACVSIRRIHRRQHASAYVFFVSDSPASVSIRQHPSHTQKAAYVSIRMLRE